MVVGVELLVKELGVLVTFNGSCPDAITIVFLLVALVTEPRITGIYPWFRAAFGVGGKRAPLLRACVADDQVSALSATVAALSAIILAQLRNVTHVRAVNFLS